MAANIDKITYGNSFIEIETDFQYVKGQIEDNAARFLMDFTNIDGPLRESMDRIGNALEDTARDFLEQQGISRESNLAKGIHAIVRKNSIELRSSAYRLPSTAKPDSTGHDIHTSRNKSYTYGNRVRDNGDKVGSNRYPWGSSRVLYWANQMIMPQGADFSGATGGIHSLQPWDIKRYNSTQNIQYYGGHVEFGHRTRNDGGIGFVQARPHLRPALRTVADASRGELSQVMASMLQGLGTEFDTRKRSGNLIRGLTFGSNFNTPFDINKNHTKESRFSELSRVAHSFDGKTLRNIYTIRPYDNWANSSAKERFFNRHLRENIGFGKKIDYAKYGYSEKIRELGRKKQKGETTGGSKYHKKEYYSKINNSPHYSHQNKIHSSSWYRYQRLEREREVRRQQREHYKQTVGKSTRTSKHRRRQSIFNTTRRAQIYHIYGWKTSKTRKKSGKKKKQGKSKSKGTSRGTQRGFKSQGYSNYNTRGGTRARETNRGGADPYRPTRPSDFIVEARPTETRLAGLPKEQQEFLKQSYRESYQKAADLSREHNERMERLLREKNS